MEIIKEGLELSTLIHKLQQVHFIHVASEYDCVIGWLNELGLYELLYPTAYHQYGVGSRPAL